MTGKYHLAKVKPPIDVLPNQAFGAGDVLFDWYAFEIPRGVCKLTTLNVIVPGTDTAAAAGIDMELFFATSVDGAPPPSLGDPNDAITKIKEVIANYEVEMEKNITSRWEADLKSDSWLSKNVRPMVLIFLIVCTMLLIFIDAGAIKFNVKDSYIDLLQMVLITVIGAYFGGRSFEKVKK